MMTQMADQAANAQSGAIENSAVTYVPAAASASQNPQVPQIGPGESFSQRFRWHALALVLIAGASILTWRAMTTRATVPPPSAAVSRVSVARIDREDLYNEITIPAEFRPYLKVALHAKVSGYLDQINVDIGDKVKAGQLLARLEVPELRNELSRAKAVEQRAEADSKDAHANYTRLLGVDRSRTNLVLIPQQELDTAEARDLTTQAAVASAKAEVERVETLLAYTRITAPFDGVITHRYADPGSLIQAGTASDTQSLPLVCLSDNYRLRLDFPVSVGYVKDIRIGDPVEVRVESLHGKVFTNSIARFAQKVDEETRTMTTEIEVSNSNLELVPGMYATVVLKVQQRPNALVVPTEAVSSDKQPSVYVVNDQHEIQEQAVKLGLEMPGKFEVLAGLKEGDLVMIGGRSQVKPGQKVEAKLN